MSWPGTRLGGGSPASQDSPTAPMPATLPVSRPPPAIPATVLRYRPRPEVRAAVRTAVGRRPAADVGPLTWIECRTGDEVVATVDSVGVGLCILDGEAHPRGGGGLTR